MHPQNVHAPNVRPPVTPTRLRHHRDGSGAIMVWPQAGVE
jgi:hypothetical protein